MKMGKGDKRSKKGKIFSKSNGNSRPKTQNVRRNKAEAAAKVKEAGK
jgi:ribosomal small subunit protein bTHX